MSKLKNIIFTFVIALFSLFIINVDAATTIKENSKDYNGDVYIIGGTKFDNNYTITATRAAVAGSNQLLLEMQFGDYRPGQPIEIKTYYYSGLTKKWYVIPEAGGNVENVTEPEKETLEKDLEIFYVNNEVKMLDFTPNVPVYGNTHEEFGVEYVDGVFKVPATQTYFEFTTENNKEAIVDTELTNDDELDVGEFFIAGINVVVRAYDYKDRDNIESAEYRNQFYLDSNNKLSIHDENQLYESYDEYAVMEYVDKDGNPINVLDMTFEEGDIVFQKLEKAAFISNGRKYPVNKLNEHLNLPNSNVQLLSNVELTEDLILETENAYVNFDLNGKTLSCDGNCKRILRANGKYSNIYISNGTIEADSAQGITIGQKTTDDQSINLTVTEDLVINADTYGITIFGLNANLDFYGEINIKNDGYGISGNGSEGYSGTNITIHEEAKITATHKDGFALYLPQYGFVNIYGGEFTAASVIGIKSGNLHITGGTLTATGDEFVPVYPTNDGTESTGDVIYVEMNDKYPKDVNITIGEEATLSSQNAGDILVYNSNSKEIPYINYEGHTTIDKTFDENGKDYTRYVEDNEAIISVDGLNYTANSYKYALEQENISSIKLLKNLEIEEDIIFDNDNINVTFDLNGKTLSCKGECNRIIRVNSKNSSFAIKNGTIEAGSAQGITVGQKTTEQQNISVMVDKDVTINADTYGITVFGQGTYLNFYGEINIKNDGYGITGNGSAEYSGTNITIHEGAKITATHKDGFALYLPQDGYVDIQGGELTAASVIGIKSGILNISGGTLNATGDKFVPVYPTNDGTESTGDVIYVEMNDRYPKNVSITIGNEATLNSKNADNILVYNSNSEETPYINYEGHTTIDKTLDENGKAYTRYLANEEADIEINNILYTTRSIYKAIEDNSEISDINIKLLKSVAIPKDIIFESKNQTINLDLNEKTLSCAGECTRILRVNGTNNTLNVQNGVIEAGSAQGITVGQKTTEQQNVSASIANNVVINADTYGITVFGQGATLYFSGEINIKNDGYGIAGNGTAGFGGTTISIETGAKINATHEDGFALYLPQAGTTVINGGELTAATVIGIKAGNLTIAGGTLKAVGNKFTALAPTNDGSKSTGDAIFVEINKNYTRNIIIDITDEANITSENGNIIQSYKSNIEESQLNETPNTLTMSGKYTTEVVDTNNNRLSTYN